MKNRRFLIKNVFKSNVMKINFGELEFTKPIKIFPKRVKNRIKDAIALLKGHNYLKPRECEVSDSKSITVNLDCIQGYIMENHYELMKHYNVKDCVCLIGSKEFYELTKQTVNYPLRFSMADFQVDRLQYKLMGMYVVILPWMDGTLLVPKEYFPIDRELVPSA